MKGVGFAFEVIGTAWQVEIFDELSKTAAEKLRQGIMDRIEMYDRNYSRFRDDSLVSRMAKRAGEYQLPSDAAPLLDMYQKLYRTTDGAVTPLIGQTLSDAGYDASYSLKPGRLTPPPKWEEVITYTPEKLTLSRPALLDFGAAGKGYLTDIIGSLLLRSGVQSYYIDAGGDILYRTTGRHVIDIALEHPADPELAVGIVSLSGGSLCGSAGNRRSWEGYHHILDPHSLQSPKHLASVWVMADNGLVADGLATALFFVQPEVLRKDFDFEYALVRADMSLEHSPGFPGRFFTGTKVRQ